MFLLVASRLDAQDNIEQYKNKTYIFDSYEQVTECSALGAPVAGAIPITVIKGSIFTVERVMANGDLVIRFNQFNLYKDPAKRAIAITNRLTYNFKTEPQAAVNSVNRAQDNVRFFLLAKNTMTASCSEYVYTSSWTIYFGTITTPFKFRFKPFLFTTNLSLGAAICFQKTFHKDFSWGIIPGLSLSSVTLDSFSTRGTVTTSSDRPAITPSVHGMLGYRNINLLVGIGWDFINKTSTIEESWIYQGKMWMGVGIGISLFAASNTSANTNTTQSTSK